MMRRTSSDDRVRKLRSKVKASIGMRFRSLPSHHLTRRLGDIFRTNISITSPTQSDYDKSKDCDELDDFVSHTWAAQWFQKGISLCYVYNHTCAIWAATLTALLL